MTEPADRPTTRQPIDAAANQPAGAATPSDRSGPGSDAHVPLLQAVELTRYYADGDVTAVRDVSLQIDQGQYVALVGKSGSGKSTLLNLLGGLDRPSSGQVRYRGQDLALQADLTEFRRHQLGFVFQSFHLISVLTAVQNVQMPMFGGGLVSAARRSRALQLLDQVGMSHRANQRPPKLSVGERQRVAIARALANQPAILMADEPTGNLDSGTAESIFTLFDDLHAAGTTILLITHDSALARRAQRTIRLVDGRLAGD